MTSQQIGDEALEIYRANRDDQERMDSLLKAFFAQVRADEYEDQLSVLRMEMGKCVHEDTSLPAISS